MTRGIYLTVIQDVINKVRPEFINGPGEEQLVHLQATWESKMMLAGVVGTPAVDLNVPVFPPSPLRAPVQPQPQQPLPGTGDNMYNTPTGVPYCPYMQPPYHGMTSQTYQTVGGVGEFVKLEDCTSVKVEGDDDEPPFNQDDDDLDDVEGEEDMNTEFGVGSV